MLGNIQAMSVLGWRLCKLHDTVKITSGQASLGKVSRLTDTVALFLSRDDDCMLY